ncbi:MAG: hypothetical protein IPG71_13060 [bacterium]|nr:hypothetical protein [bacterium]
MMMALNGLVVSSLFAQLQVGDPVSIDVTLPACDSVAVVETGDLPLRVLPLTQANSRSATRRAFTFEVALYDTGSYVIPSLGVVPFRNGIPLDTVWSGSRPVEINSTLDDTTTTPRPIKPYAEHPLRFADLLREYWLWLVGVIALAALVFAWRKWMRRAKSGVAIAAPPPLPPADLAVRELIALRDKRYPERGLLKEHYSEFSEVMRRYVEGRYEFPALEMTTYELATEFRRQELPACWREVLLPILRESDLVKFAKEIPTLGSCAAILETGFALIEQTKPTQDTAEASKAA